jgi:protein O-GlcNAc transferase
MEGAAAHLGEERLNLLYIGARQSEEVDEPLTALLADFDVRLTAFDADPDARELVERRFGSACEFMGSAVGRGSEVTFNLMDPPGHSSIFMPGRTIGSLFQNFTDKTVCLRQDVAPTVRLDDAVASETIDLLKIDVQGGQLEVFAGAERVLSETAVIDVECELVEQYEGAPLFAETAEYLRVRGFQFHRFVGYGSRQIAGVIDPKDPLAPGSQWLWAECLFVPRFDRWSDLSPRALRGLAAVLLKLYGSLDLAMLALALNDARDEGIGPALWASGLQRLADEGLTVDPAVLRQTALSLKDAAR